MRENSVNSIQICALSDGRAGNVRQVEALGGAFAHDFSELILEPQSPWRWAAPRRWPGAERAYGDAFAALLDTPPRIAIGCGRQAALATRLLRERGTKAVQILDPRIDPKHWDLIVVPEHDRLRGPNVITTLGSLHPIDDAWLARARTEFATFSELPRPINAVLLGGSSRHARFDRMAFEVLASKLEAVLAREGGSVLLTASRRTPKELRDVLKHRYDDTPGVIWRNSKDGRNPYAGLLAWADRIICSPDSVNMVTEACATRAPVFVFDPGRVRGRPHAFLDTLLSRGRIRAMDARLDAFDVEPLRETARVASAIRECLG
ncbi:MAG: mitochondrial fission ELM1 family protein [Lysobacteraceae bacterium]